MNINLLEITTDELLEKFGAGKHKPGSGSAAALQGMLASKLLVTVISLTNVSKRQKRYGKVLPELLAMDAKIQERIFPKLAELFQEDAVQFDKAIQARKDRDNEKDVIKSNLLRKKALDELKGAIKIPIEITKLCIELAGIADYVFDKAFQGARGDSQVALSSAVAGIAGCLSIIQLNLLSFGSDEYSWTSKVTTETKRLKEQFIILNGIAGTKIESLENEVSAKAEFYKEVDELLKSLKSKTKLTDEDIENAASNFQNVLWKYRELIWLENIPDHPAKVLQPGKAFKKALAFNFVRVEKLDIVDDENGSYETAGIIDQENKIVLVSDYFDNNTQNFTAAHELGHALLHKQSILHRDRPINGTLEGFKRDFVERQADKFATNFLMPAKLVRNEFQQMFLTNRFVINEQTAFDLIRDSPSKLKSNCKDLRGLSLKLASSERYSNNSFISIAELFNVSITAMAIRLEELDLVEF